MCLAPRRSEKLWTTGHMYRHSLMGPLSEGQSLVLCVSLWWLFLLSSMSGSFNPSFFFYFLFQLFSCCIFLSVKLLLLARCFPFLSWCFSFYVSLSPMSYVFVINFIPHNKKDIYARKDYLTSHMLHVFKKQTKIFTQEEITLRSWVSCFP